MTTQGDLLPAERIERSIYVFRGQRVMLDSDLAMLYGVTTARLNEQVRRNQSRFPSDFAFRLRRDEFNHLISHFATSKPRRGGRRTLPLVFTEHGILMLSSVLRSSRAIQVNIQIMRTFVRLRQMVASHDELLRRIESLEKQYDEQFRIIFDAIRQLVEPPPTKQRGQIGFKLD